MNVFKPLRLAFLGCAALALTIAAGPAFAHAKLLSEAPVAEDVTDARPTTGPTTEFRLAFSEALNAAFSKVQVKDPSSAPVEGATVTLDPKDDKMLVVTFAAPLPIGEYTVDWTAVSNDGHKTTGTYKVKVAQ